MEQKYAELALSDLVGAGDEVYVLGNGNSREVQVRLLGKAEVGFGPGERNASISVLNGSTVLWKGTMFRTGSGRIELDGGVSSVTVRCEGGEVEFESR